MTASSGVTFDAETTVLLNGGTTTVSSSNILTATHTGRTTSIDVHVLSGVTFDTSANLVCQNLDLISTRNGEEVTRA